MSVRDEDTGRLVVRGVNEGGFACVDIDLADLFAWFGIDAEATDKALVAMRAAAVEAKASPPAGS